MHSHQFSGPPFGYTVFKHHFSLLKASSNPNSLPFDTNDNNQDVFTDTHDTDNHTSDTSHQHIETTNQPSTYESFPSNTFLKPLPQVPWGLSTTITVMAMWLVGFWFAAYSLVPSILQLTLGISSSHLSSTTSSSTYVIQQALRHLFLDLTQLFFTMLLLHRALDEYHPRKLGLFKIQITPVKTWLPIVLVGCAFFPGIDWIHKKMVAILANSGEVFLSSTFATTPSASSIITDSGWAARSLWFAVLALLAPVWEEIMFRGFLLPSLGKHFGPYASIFVTSIVFAMVHFTKEGFLPLLLLGCIFGAAYVKTLNLVPAILLHSLWNVCLLAQIMITG